MNCTSLNLNFPSLPIPHLLCCLPHLSAYTSTTAVAPYYQTSTFLSLTSCELSTLSVFHGLPPSTTFTDPATIHFVFGSWNIECHSTYIHFLVFLHSDHPHDLSCSLLFCSSPVLCCHKFQLIMARSQALGIITKIQLDTVTAY